MNRHREMAELVALFGRDAVDSAIASKESIHQWAWENSEAVALAASELRAKLGNPPDAVAYAAGLDPLTRLALIVTIMEV